MLAVPAEPHRAAPCRAARVARCRRSLVEGAVGVFIAAGQPLRRCGAMRVTRCMRSLREGAVGVIGVPYGRALAAGDGPMVPW